MPRAPAGLRNFVQVVKLTGKVVFRPFHVRFGCFRKERRRRRRKRSSKAGKDEQLRACQGVDWRILKESEEELIHG